MISKSAATVAVCVFVVLFNMFSMQCLTGNQLQAIEPNESEQLVQHLRHTISKLEQDRHLLLEQTRSTLYNLDGGTDHRPRQIIGNGSSISNATKTSNTSSSFPDWVLPFVGDDFRAYRARIDQRIKDYRHTLRIISGEKQSCSIDIFKGEFGYEIGAVVQHVYDTSLYCPVETWGLEGTTYLYWFSMNHSIYKGRQRNAMNLPPGNPFGPTIHRSLKDFPKSNWTMPDYKSYYQRDDVKLDKPLVMVFNKYTPETHVGGTVNFIPIHVLRDILNYLVPNYFVIYNRLQRKELDEADDKNMTFGDKEMIRNEFVPDGNVVLLDDLVDDLDPEAVNLMIFSLGALCKRFISVQGGNSQVASFFGGTNIIMAKRGKELQFGDFGYYHMYANTTVMVVKNENDLLTRIKQEM